MCWLFVLRQALVYDLKLDKNVGYVNLGGIANDDNQQLATEALFFQIVSFTKLFKCPVAYFLLNKVSADMQAQFIKCIIDELHNIGISVRSLTCDGTITNLNTYERLGCNFDFFKKKKKTNFVHSNDPATNIHC